MSHEKRIARNDYPLAFRLCVDGPDMTLFPKTRKRVLLANEVIRTGEVPSKPRAPKFTFVDHMGPYRMLVFLGLYISFSTLHAGNCLITGGKKIGDCENVQVGPGQPLNVKTSGSFSGNYTRVTVQSGVNANISGNTDEVLVRAGATLYLSGNTDRVRVEGTADLSGNSGWVYVAKSGTVTIRGIVDGVSGPGKIIKVPGAIINGIYIK